MAETTGTPATVTPTSDQPTTTPASPPRRPSQVEMDREIALVRTALEADYDVVAELGRGGMAVVYLASEKQLEREVAIKVLRAALAADDEFVERFKHEARTAGKLEHPNIVPIYRVGQSGHVIYFVMKYLRGQSLSIVLKERGKLNVPEIRRILMECAAALGYAAKQNVVHRDIKPDNILLDHEGRCVVTDFGIAKAPGGTHTAPGTSLGTPRYMSPEHAQGTPLDGRSDMYSLGVVAYQCLTGRTPFEADDPFAMLYKHINEPLPRPTFDDPAESELFAIIERMLAKKADDRYQTTNELIVALGGEVSGPILADASGPIQRAVMIPTMPMTTPLPFTIRTRVRGYWKRLLEEPRWAVAAAVAAIGLGIGIGVGFARAGSAAPTPAVDTARIAQASITSTPSASAGAIAPAGPVTKTVAAVTGAKAPPATTAATSGASASRTKMLAGTSGTTKSTPSLSSTQRSATVRALTAAPTLFSRCPRLDGAAATKNLALMVDSITQQTSGGQLDVAYDVCGLPEGSPFMAEFTLRKLDQNRLRRLVRATFKPVVISFADVSNGPRTRHHRMIPLAGIPEGQYAIDAAVTDRESRTQTTTRTFAVKDKPDSSAFRATPAGAPSTPPKRDSSKPR